jgi:hypothetical protein
MAERLHHSIQQRKMQLTIGGDNGREVFTIVVVVTGGGLCDGAVVRGAHAAFRCRRAGWVRRSVQC